jgi:hypothetical protein
MQNAMCVDRGEALSALKGGHLPEFAVETRVLDREAQRRLHAGHDDAEAPAGAPRDGLLRDDREDAQHVGVLDAALTRRLLAEGAHLRLGRVGWRLLDCDIAQGPRRRRAHPAEAAAPELLRKDEPRARDRGSTAAGGPPARPAPSYSKRRRTRRSLSTAKGPLLPPLLTHTHADAPAAPRQALA